MAQCVGGHDYLSNVIMLMLQKASEVAGFQIISARRLPWAIILRLYALILAFSSLKKGRVGENVFKIGTLRLPAESG